jgi:hypothetical protein
MVGEARHDGLARLYDLALGDEDARVCRDIPEQACREAPRNFGVFLVAQTAAKIGDELANAKTVLPWLLSAVGAPGALVGVLVPVRESLALLPQLVVASLLRRAPVRKWFWVAGSLAQGLAVLAIALLATRLVGAAAGVVVLALLAAFSLARGVCSVVSKDVLGKTISKTHRGRLMGYAASAAGLVTIAAGLATGAGGRPSSPEALALLLVPAAGLWLLAAALFSGLRETPGATEGGGNALGYALRSFGLLRSDPGLRTLVIARSLLMGSALAPPFLVVLLRGQGPADLASLGLLITASGLASALSAPLWGRMADRSARRVLIVAGLLAVAVGVTVFAAEQVGVHGWARELGYPLAFLVLSAAHSGIRLGRKTQLVDMATAESRAAYVAVSNTVIGAALLAGGAFGLLADATGPAFTLLVLSSMILAGVFWSTRLPEAQAPLPPTGG